jgi:hypothetical protein
MKSAVDFTFSGCIIVYDYYDTFNMKDYFMNYATNIYYPQCTDALCIHRASISN